MESPALRALASRLGCSLLTAENIYCKWQWQVKRDDPLVRGPRSWYDTVYEDCNLIYTVGETNSDARKVMIYSPSGHHSQYVFPKIKKVEPVDILDAKRFFGKRNLFVRKAPTLKRRSRSVCNNATAIASFQARLAEGGAPPSKRLRRRYAFLFLPYPPNPMIRMLSKKDGFVPAPSAEAVLRKERHVSTNLKVIYPHPHEVVLTPYRHVVNFASFVGFGLLKLNRPVNDTEWLVHSAQFRMGKKNRVEALYSFSLDCDDGMVFTPPALEDLLSIPPFCNGAVYHCRNGLRYFQGKQIAKAWTLMTFVLFWHCYNQRQFFEYIMSLWPRNSGSAATERKRGPAKRRRTDTGRSKIDDDYLPPSQFSSLPFTILANSAAKLGCQDKTPWGMVSITKNGTPYLVFLDSDGRPAIQHLIVSSST